MTKSLLFPTVSEPVVHSDFSDQVRAEASKLGGRHAPLEAFCPERGNQTLFITIVITSVNCYKSIEMYDQMPRI